MTEKLKPQPLPILNPEQVFSRYSPQEIGEIFGKLLDDVYGGRSDRIDGHPPKKFQERIEEGILYPFLVFDDQKPIACYGVQWYGEKVDMGNAAVLPEYRGTKLISGKQLYIDAHKWAETNLARNTAIITGGSRIPVSAAIAINNCDRFPCWLPPFPSWGYTNEPLEENNGRRHEFLMVSEKYPQGNAYAPREVYVPHNEKVAYQISRLWQNFSNWNNQEYIPETRILDTELNKVTLTRTKGDDERVRFDCQTDQHSLGLTLEQALYYCFQNPESSGIPKTRGVAIDIDASHPSATAAQDFLLDHGFIFTGIFPGMHPVEIFHPNGTRTTYQRAPINVYGLLRPGLKEHIQRDNIPMLRNKVVQSIFEEIREEWLK